MTSLRHPTLLPVVALLVACGGPATEPETATSPEPTSSAGDEATASAGGEPAAGAGAAAEAPPVGVTVSRGPLTVEQVTAALEPVRSAVRSCLVAEGRDAAAGSLGSAILVAAPDGSMQNVNLSYVQADDGSDAFAATTSSSREEVDACLRHALYEVRFPEAEAATRFRTTLP